MDRIFDKLTIRCRADAVRKPLALAAAAGLLAALVAAILVGGQPAQFGAWFTGAVAGALPLAVLLFALAGRTDRIEDRMTALSLRDPVTWLKNWGAFEEDGAAILDRATEGTVLVVAIDGFDRLDRAAGEAAMKAAADRIRDSLRRADLIGVIGGGKFGIVALGLGEAARPRVIARLAASEGPRLTLGWAEIGPEPDLHELVVKADLALYRAQATGERVVTYDPSFVTLPPIPA